MRSQQDFFSGLLFIALGGAFAIGAGSYVVGTPGDMGPGYFPRLTGILGCIVGVAVLVGSFKASPDEDGRIGPWAWKPLVCVVSANLVFGVMVGGLPSIGLPPLGLVLGVYSLVVIASLASQEFKVVEVLAVSTVLAAGVYLVCVKLLNLYVPLWPPIFAG